MSLRFYNTLSHSKEAFEPRVPGKVGMYTCGPTVYNLAHIGNLRTFMFQDLLRRHLEYRGFDVTHVMNITDVEDKIIRTCRETGETLKDLTSRYTEMFFYDLKVLGVRAPGVAPRATDHIDEMVDIIKQLGDKGHTYEMDGSIYFRIGSFPNYGKLSHFDLDTLQRGASGRVDTDEYPTEDPRDFALWKAYVEEDGEVYWETEFGKGRPGWHIECSCMSMKYLGDSFDIHCGAVDLVFPHHENEIAQSEGATGKPFVKYWLHAAHLNLSGRKISKSLGNMVTLQDLLDEGHSPMAIRWALRATHYRQPTNFSTDSLAAADSSLRRIRDFRLRLEGIRRQCGSDLAEACAECEQSFGIGLDDDLNISAALAAIFDFIRLANRLMDEDDLSAEGAANALALLVRLDEVVGLLGGEENGGEAPADILDLVQKRQEARRGKDFAESDRIRDELAARGWVVEDTPDGPRVKQA